MTEYKIIVKDASGNTIGEVTNWFNLTFKKSMNEYGTCKFTVPVTDTNLIQFIGLRRYTVWIYRNNVLVWAGEQALLQNSLKANNANLVTIVCYSWFEQLYSRFTSETFTGIDAGAIAWDLIETTQAETDGNIGITEGTIETTQPRDRTYSDDCIATEISRLTEVINGFDFEITDNKVFNVYAQIGLDKTNSVVFEYGTNIKEVTKLNQDFSIITNQSIVRGEGQGTEQARVVRTDTSSRGLYGLRQRITTEYNVSSLDTLNEVGDAINAKRSSPILEVTFTQETGTQPTFGSLGIGDLVSLKINHGIHSIDNVYRIYGYEVSFDYKGEEIVQYYISN